MLRNCGRLASTSRGVVGVAAVLVALGTITPPGHAVAGLLPAASLTDPAAPGYPVPPCTFAPLGTTEVRTLALDWLRQGVIGAGSSPPEWQFPAVDPHDPCRTFALSTGSHSNQLAVAGRLDAGTWTTMLDSSSVAVQNNWTPPAITANGTVLVADAASKGSNAGLQGIRASQDEGRTWAQRDSGIPPGFFVTGITVSPSDANEAFALAWTPGLPLPLQAPQPALFVTRDGASTWSPVPLVIQGAPPMVAIDPFNGNDVFVLASALAPGGSVLSASTDGGRSWAPAQPINAPAAATACGLVAAHSLGASVAYVKFCTGVSPNAPVGTGDVWERTANGGATFSPLSLPAAIHSVLTVDGRDHHTLLWAAPVVAPDGTHWLGTHLIASSDEFRSSIADVVRANTLDWRLPPPNPPSGPAGPSIDPDPPVLLQSDAQGDFFLYLGDYQNAPVSPYEPVVADHLVAFRVSALSAQSQQPSPGGSNGTSAGGGVTGTAGNGVDPAARYVDDLRTCAIPAVPPSPTGASSYTSGSVAFDGDYLDYTYIDPQGAQGIAGVIYRLSPDCSPAPPLGLDAADFPLHVLPEVYWLVYDPVLPLPGGAEGALVISTAVPGTNGVDPGAHEGQGAVYAVSPITGRAWPLFQKGGSIYSYDASRAAFWKGDWGNANPFGLETLSGQALPSCMSGSPLDDANVTSSIVYAAPGTIYTQSEDDATVLRVDTSNCQVTGGFTHRSYSESGGENDQLACDPLTFGNGAGGFSVLWIKDVGPNTVTAYAIPDGYCPFPTALRYDGDTRAGAGSGVTLCATLTAQRAGRRDELPDKPVTFSLNGRTVGASSTDAHGRACLPTRAPGQASTYPVHAVFAGDRSYAPSETTASLITLATSGSSGPAAFLGPIGGSSVPGLAGSPPQPTVSSEVQPAAQAQAQSQAQAQAQAEAQSQMQSQSQSMAQVQPGVMLQKQKRAQIATQGQPAGTAYEATAWRRPAPAPWVPAAAGVLLLTFGLLLRRPRWRAAQASRGGGPPSG